MPTLSHRSFIGNQKMKKILLLVDEFPQVVTFFFFNLYSTLQLQNGRIFLVKIDLFDYKPLQTIQNLKKKE